MILYTKDSLENPTDTLLIPVAGNGAQEKSLKAIASFFDIPFKSLDRDFKGEENEVFSFYSKQQKIYLLGLGAHADFAKVLTSFRSFSHHFKQKIDKKIGISFLHQNISTSNLNWIEAAVNGLVLGTYDIGLFKTDKEDKTHPLGRTNASLEIFIAKKNIDEALTLAQKGQIVAETQLQIFDLVNAPGNKKIPSHLANWAERSGKKYGYSVINHSKSELFDNNLHALLAVGRGSENPPAFIVMEYKPQNGKINQKIGLVGKGVTFDTGGISIKPSSNMHLMKSDMGGAGAVFGAMELAAKLQLPIHLIGIVPATENSVDALSIKPGDVIDSYSGKTIEIIDTDAEGRLILADGLSYMVRNFQPEVLIDLATLTGSAVRTFGYHAAAIFSNNDNLSNQFSSAGDRTGERVWPLPIWDIYKEDIQSDVADVRNFSGKPIAGAISAAKFLEVFTDEHPNWAHLDIAGVAFGPSPFSSQRNATAFGVRLLLDFLENLK